MIRKAGFGLAASLAVAAPGHAEFSERERPNVAAMSIKQIRIHNEGLDPADPYYITCKRYTVTGTLAKRQRTCLTRKDWALREERAQDFVQKRIEGALSGPASGGPGG